jgi:hypothetical protein
VALELGIALFLVAATIVTSSLWREVLVVEARVGSVGTRAIDGPEIGTLAPPQIRREDGVYLFLSDHCPACHDVVSQFREAEAQPQHRVRAVRVADQADYGRTQSPIIESLPPALPALDDAVAKLVVRELAIRATPLAIAVRGGLIASKGYVRGPDDVVEVARPLRVVVR